MSEGYTGLPAYYLQSSDPITPNLLLSLKGMDPIVAEDFVKIDTFAAGPFGSTLDVNGVPVASPNFVNSATVVFSVVGSNVSATAVAGGVGTVTSVGTSGLATGGPIVSAGTINVAGSGSTLVAATAAASIATAPSGDLITSDGLGNVQDSGTLLSAVALKTQLPQTFAAVAGEFINSYNATTGLFTASAAGTGTVTSVSFTGGLISVATPTTTPALTVAGTSGGVVYFNSATTWASSALLPAGDFVLGGGAGAAPTATFSVVPVTNGGTGTGSTLVGVVRGGNPFTASEISGDATTSGSNALTLATVNANVGSFTYASITVNAKGLITAASSGAAPTGTVTSFSAGNIGSIITSAVATPTTTPALTFTIATEPANTVWAGPTTGAADIPTFRALVAADLPAGSGTVTSVSFTGGLISVATPTTTPALTVAGTSGGIPYFNSATTWASSAVLASTGLVIGGGAGTAPLTDTQLTWATASATLTVGLAGTSSGILSLTGSTSGNATITAPAVAGTATNPVVFSNSITTNHAILAITGTFTGASSITLGSAGINSGVITLEGSTSGSCTITAPAVAGTTSNAITFSNAINTASTVQGSKGIFSGTAGVQLGLAGTASGLITFEGSTSGSCTITAPAVASTVTNALVSSNSFNLSGTGAVYQAQGTSGVTQTAEAVGTLATIGGIVTTFTAVSDERLKIFVPYEGGLDALLSIVPIRYRWNEKGQKISGQKGDRDYIGFSADNVQKSIPESIQSKKGPEGYLSFDDRPVIAALVNAVKELLARIEVLEARK